MSLGRLPIRLGVRSDLIFFNFLFRRTYVRYLGCCLFLPFLYTPLVKDIREVLHYCDISVDIVIKSVAMLIVNL
jgi:hypothetical protein